jgi:hypothetical protein
VARISTFDFDGANREHLARHEIEDNLIWEVFLGEPRFFVNPPREGRSGSHLMIGPSATGRWWTIVIVNVDDARATWRPITGWPSTRREIRLWQGE